MGIKQIDNDLAVREGWARDQDNEVAIDGYNALILVSTYDGTSGFHVVNTIGSTVFSAHSNGDGYFARRLGINTENPVSDLEVVGKIRTETIQILDGALSGYVLTSDNDGNATWLPVSSATELLLDGYVEESTFQDNKANQSEINNHILSSLDGYAQNSTVTEHYTQFSQAIQDIVSTIDGYSTDIEFTGLALTVEENKTAQNLINQSILKELDSYQSQINGIYTTEQEHYGQFSQNIQDILSIIDGYAQNSTITEHYAQFSQLVQDVISVIDGYSTDIEFFGLTNTVEENKTAQNLINQSILKDLDSYQSQINGIYTTEQEHYNQFGQAIQNIISVIDGYSTDIEFAGLTATVEAHKLSQSEVNQTILKDLDGYAQNSTITEHYAQFSQAIQNIVSIIDGYSTDIEFAGLTITVEENKTAQNLINQSILKDLDGYAYIPNKSVVADGYITFFTDDKNLAGDNDLYFDRVNNQLQVSNFKLTTNPIDGYVLTTDTSGNATWQKNNALDESEHRQLDQLVHNIAEDSFEEYIYSGSFVTSIIIWTNSSKVKKIREELFIYSGANVSTITKNQYDNNNNIVETLLETFTYSGSFVTSVSRTYT